MSLVNNGENQTDCTEKYDISKSIADRLTVFRNKNICCDVEFIVGVEKKAIRAHKLVFGCSSKVFEAMFYGKMAQSSQEDKPMTVLVPDVTPNSFTALVKFLYSDFDTEAELGDDVMQTLYAAKKYDVKALVLACTKFLTTSLTASNALTLLSQARFFDEPVLAERCLCVIDAKTDEALRSTGIGDIDFDTLAQVVKRSQLRPSSELVIFNAAKSWSEAECKRRKMEVIPSNQRLVLGTILSHIRFPLMTVHEFGEAASSSILNCEEIAQVFLHLTVVPSPSVSYLTDKKGSRRQVVNRFRGLASHRCSRIENKFCFMVNQEILVIAFGIFGFAKNTPDTPLSSVPDCWETQVKIELLRRDGPESPLLASETVVVQGRVGDEKPVVASFGKPVYVGSDVFHEARMNFLTLKSVTTYCGSNSVRTMSLSLPANDKIIFHFQASDSNPNCYSYDNPYSFDGQIPEIHFITQCLDEID